MTGKLKLILSLCPTRLTSHMGIRLGSDTVFKKKPTSRNHSRSTFPGWWKLSANFKVAIGHKASEFKASLSYMRPCLLKKILEVKKIENAEW